MDNTEVINPFSLPHLPLTDLKQLPARPAVYFALKDEQVLYIGQSVNLQQRWTTHHRWQQLVKTEGDIRIAWLECSDISLLTEIERALIEHFIPPLNGSPLPKLSRVGATKTTPFTFRCPDKVLAAIEERANAQGVSKTEAVIRLILLGLQSTQELDNSTPASNTLEELEERLSVKVETLRSEFLTKLSALDRG